MVEESLKCGLIAVVGAPNAGKSTLVNALVGQKVAIVSPKAQTTRVRLMGVAIEGESQLLLVDTPGIFEARRRLDRAMVSAAWGGTSDADLIALVIDAKAGLTRKTEALVQSLAERREPKIVILNKVDVTPKEQLLELATKLDAALRPETISLALTELRPTCTCTRSARPLASISLNRAMLLCSCPRAGRPT